MSAIILNFTGNNQEAVVDLRGKTFSRFIEVASAGDYNGGLIELFRRINGADIPYSNSWDNQGVYASLNAEGSGLTLSEISAEESLVFKSSGSSPAMEVTVSLLNMGFPEIIDAE